MLSLFNKLCIYLKLLGISGDWGGASASIHSENARKTPLSAPFAASAIGEARTEAAAPSGYQLGFPKYYFYLVAIDSPAYFLAPQVVSFLCGLGEKNTSSYRSRVPAEIRSKATTKACSFLLFCSLCCNWKAKPEIRPFAAARENFFPCSGRHRRVQNSTKTVCFGPQFSAANFVATILI